MASTEVALRSQAADRQPKRKPFASWVKKIANFKSGDEPGTAKKKGASKHKKSQTHTGTFKNNPYPQSRNVAQRPHSPVSSVNGQLSFYAPTSQGQDDDRSYNSLPPNSSDEKEEPSNGKRSAAPTLATNPDTVHSDAGHSKAATSTTRGGALSSVDGAGAHSNFSSPNQSERSLTTTLTTIQSQSAGNALQNSASGHHSTYHHGSLNNPNPVMFSHQYPVSPAPSTTMTASAIPRHMSEAMPNTYSSATANNLWTDDASILTLASSSKRRRRRSMDTDASIRAIPPGSVWGGSRESLPISVLSGNMEGATGGFYSSAQSRPSIGGLASAERASVYSTQGVSAPALASERNSYYRSAKDPADAKSLRSITMDARSQYDARSINADARSMHDARSQLGDVGSLRNYEGSVRSGALGHARNDSIPGSIGSPLSGAGSRHLGTSGALSRRSSEWREVEERDGDEEEEDEDADGESHGRGREHAARRDEL
ncbi:hypothetical protein BAUCODRAFT_33234 [Baudoinia panamericana UAMH 10762]|uniref:Ca2+-modulated nonselective cation channel polycystin n=1 Tax=Baudoinia panamericana (strain UAMH 10762) TaxID=717646 RepID=M2NE81_BAUPA|nr:uncharacterized protein BAUCODRAFT_33234 [Baudoinia panamericana UAMH 10762]EMC97519.1 hypothetical protein BAUCODRAFT_33234 [Baudoinia panamericana UAMH 10762]